MKVPADYMKVVFLTVCVCFTVLVSFGVMHALSVPAVNSIFFLDYEPAKNVWVFALQSSYFFVVVCTFPINTNAAFNPFEEITAYKAILVIKGNPFWLKNIFRFIGCLLMIILVSVAPELDQVCGFVGGILGTTTIFVFSTFSYNTHFAKSISTFRKVFNYLFLTFL